MHQRRQTPLIITGQYLGRGSLRGAGDQGTDLTLDSTLWTDAVTGTLWRVDFSRFPAGAETATGARPVPGWRLNDGWVLYIADGFFQAVKGPNPAPYVMPPSTARVRVNQDGEVTHDVV